MLGDPTRHQGPRTTIAVVITEIPPELHAIRGARCKLLAQIGHKGVELTGGRTTGRALGKVIGDREAADGLTPDAELVCNRPDAQPLGMQVAYGVIPRPPLGALRAAITPRGLLVSS